MPVFDEAGQVVEMYGRKVRDDLRPGTPAHLYLPGPHQGVWNLPAVAASGEVIVCQSLIDALTFWCAGFRHVTVAYGVEGFTADHLDAFRRHRVGRVLIAFDRDDASDRAAFYSTKQIFTGTGTVRDWLNGQSFADQYEFGMDTLRKIENGLPLP